MIMERALPRRCIRVRYEELILQPGAVFAELCSFLSIPFEAAAVENALLVPHLIGPVIIRSM
jgi:hypothetical protein